MLIMLIDGRMVESMWLGVKSVQKKKKKKKTKKRKIKWSCIVLGEFGGFNQTIHIFVWYNFLIRPSMINRGSVSLAREWPVTVCARLLGFEVHFVLVHTLCFTKDH